MYWLSPIVARAHRERWWQKRIQVGQRNFNCYGSVVLVLVLVVFAVYVLYDSFIILEEQVEDDAVKCNGRQIRNGHVGSAFELGAPTITCDEGYQRADTAPLELACRQIKKTCLKNQTGFFKPEYAFATQAAAEAAVDVSRHEVDAAREYARGQLALLTEDVCIKPSEAVPSPAAAAEASSPPSPPTPAAQDVTPLPTPAAQDVSSSEQDDATGDTTVHASPMSWTPRSTLCAVLALALVALCALVAAGVSRGRRGSSRRAGHLAPLGITCCEDDLVSEDALDTPHC